MTLAATVASSCASPHVSSLSVRRHSALKVGARSPAARNQALARAEAARLLSRTVLEPGAARTTSQPTNLDGPAMGLPSSSQMIDEVAYFRLATSSLERTRAWFAAHPQPGLVRVGMSISGDRSGPTGYGFEYDPPPSTTWSWGSAKLEIALAPLGTSGSAIRVDGLADWINPTPARDTRNGRTVHLTIAGGCPPSDRGLRDVSNPGDPDLDRRLLPATNPTAAVQCRYAGLNGSPFRLRADRRLSAAQSRAEAHRIRSLPLEQWGEAVTHCPLDDGSATVLAFAYPNRPDVDIWEHTSGCPTTDNGHIVSGPF